MSASKCTTHHEACACREERWQRVAEALYSRTVGICAWMETDDLRVSTIVNLMRAVGLVKNGEKWEFIDV